VKGWQTAMAAAMAAAALTACSGGDGGGSGSDGDGGGDFAEESARTILDESEKDMKALSSVTVGGGLTTDGQQLTLDMAVSTDGSCEGTIGLQGGKAEIRSTGKQSWMKPDAAFWESFAGESAAMVQQVVGDRWVVVPGDASDFTELCDLDELLSEMRGGEDAAGEVGGTREVAGQEAVEVSTESDEGDPLTVWIAVDDPHRILEMEVTQGEEPGTITFSGFDAELDVQAPADDEVIDLDQLSG
jgi:hypothetical protein